MEAETGENSSENPYVGVAARKARNLKKKYALDIASFRYYCLKYCSIH